MKRLTSFALLFSVIIILGCQNEKTDLAIVVTDTYTTYPETFVASCNGEVVESGSGVVTERGICYKPGREIPTIEDQKVGAGSGKGVFTAMLPDISKGTWSYRAYAITSAGVAYGKARALSMTNYSVTELGEEIKEGDIPVNEGITLTIDQPDSITSTTAVVGFSATKYVDIDVVELGLLYSSTTPNPDLSDCYRRVYHKEAKIESIWTENTVRSSLKAADMLPNTTYYIRSYALTRDNKRYYSNILSFKTLDTAEETKSVSDFLGTWSCRAYNWDDNKYESWDNVEVEKFWQGTEEWIAVKGIIWGEQAIIAYGQYDQSKNCIRLYSNIVDRNKTFTAPAWHTGDTTFYAIFKAIYATSSDAYIISKGGGFDGNGESWLTINSDLKMVFGPSDKQNENGYQANGFCAYFYYSETRTLYTRSIYYTNPVFTRTNFPNVQAREFVYYPANPVVEYSEKTPYMYERQQIAKRTQ